MSIDKLIKNEDFLKEFLEGMGPEFEQDFQKFKEQKAMLNDAIGFTLTPQAWEEMKSVSKNAINIEHFRLMGKPCYIVQGQQQPVIAFFSEVALDLFLEEHGKLQRELNRKNAENN